MSGCCKANPCCEEVVCAGIPPSGDSQPAASEPKTIGQILDGVDNATVKLGDAFMSAALAFADDMKEMKDALCSMDEPETRMILAHFERKTESIGEKINKAMEAAFA